MSLLSMSTNLDHSLHQIQDHLDGGLQQKRGWEKIKRVRLFRLSAEESFNLGEGKQIREKKKAAITL